MVQFTPTFSLIIQTNAMLAYNAVDPALTCKQRVVPFTYTFVDTPARPHERQRDNLVKAACCGDDTWRDAFILMLLAAWRDGVRGAATLPQSPKFAAATAAYATEADPVATWLADSYTVDEGRVRDQATWRSTEELHADFRRVTGCEMGVQAWAGRMKDLGVPKSDNALRKGGHQSRFWQGLVPVPDGDSGGEGGTGGGGSS